MNLLTKSSLRILNNTYRLLNRYGSSSYAPLVLLKKNPLFFHDNNFMLYMCIYIIYVFKYILHLTELDRSDHVQCLLLYFCVNNGHFP